MLSTTALRFAAGIGFRPASVTCSASRNLSSSSPLPPPDATRLAATARITLSPSEVEEFGPKIRQVVDWFGQLQEVDLETFEPAVRADIDVDAHLREDLPETFENREVITSAIPTFEESYIKVPKILNME